MRKKVYLLSLTLTIFCWVACKHKPQLPSDTIASTPQQLQVKTADVIKAFASEALSGKGLFADSALLFHAKLTNGFYENNQFIPLWCQEENWLPTGDSLYAILDHAQLYGLFPEDYHIKDLRAIRERFIADSLSKGARKDAALWAKADMMLTDGFIQLLSDVKLGRLPQDSITLRKDSVLVDSFYWSQFRQLRQGKTVSELLHALEPTHKGYWALKEAIPSFLDSANYKEFTKVPLPGKDSIGFRQALQKRLYEEGFISNDTVMADSASLAQAVKKFQQKKNITVDGRAGEGTIRILNDNDRDRFIRIAISMDRYKMLPESMPKRFIWVNLPSYYMQVVDGDSVKINSKIICGKPKTRTPLLTSNVNELITYPQWVPPPSIILKEILPAVKKNPGYLAKKGFSLLDSKGEEVDPFTVDWSKYSKGIPYKVVQGSGDANALGIMKFVFPNKYSVYLHDTNQRYLFSSTTRSMSHGCVRVQEWEKLTYYLLKLDSISTGPSYSKADSVKTWLLNKQKRSVALKNKMPVFIRYITCEGKNGHVVFYDDIYGEDKRLKEKYFASK